MDGEEEVIAVRKDGVVEPFPCVGEVQQGEHFRACRRWVNSF